MFLYLLIYFLNVHSQMTDKERKLLYQRYVNKMSFRQLFETINVTDLINPSQFKIRELIERYKFPPTYDFFKDENITAKVKNQEACGCCWAFATTTALSYRFQKSGIDVDLSPQYLVSCLKKKCEGEYPINAEFFLVKNGTVTESCMPYSSNYGTVESCITKCNNYNENLKFYYSKNTYSLINNYNEENYYDIVTIIIDQLINFGPIVSVMDFYEDFYSLYGNSCSKIIYRPKKNDEIIDTHAVVIVGYGYANNKYYWIVQNSWGKLFCDNGFVKVEFGQASVERIIFSEPYIDNGLKAKSVNINLNLEPDCKFKFKIASIEKPEDFFEMNFINVDFPNSTFYYQCGFPSLKTQNEGICNYHYNYLKNTKGYYKLSDYKSLKKDNVFNLNFENFNNQFIYYNYDSIVKAFVNDLYISGEKSFIVLRTYNYSQDNRLISNIYLNINSKEPLNCKSLDFMYYNYTYIYCNFTDKHINELNEKNNNLSLVYNVLCGKKKNMSVFVYKLDKSKFPVFIIKKITIQDKYLMYGSKITLIANIEGSVSQYKGNNSFGAFINIKAKNISSVEFLHCDIPNSLKIEKNVEINCFTYYNNSIVYYDSVELLSYFYPKNNSCPFDIIDDTKNDINETKIDNNDTKNSKSNQHIINDDSGNSKIIKLSFSIIFLFFLFI